MYVYWKNGLYKLWHSDNSSILTNILINLKVSLLSRCNYSTDNYELQYTIFQTIENNVVNRLPRKNANYPVSKSQLTIKKRKKIQCFNNRFRSNVQQLQKYIKSLIPKYIFRNQRLHISLLLPYFRKEICYVLNVSK